MLFFAERIVFIVLVVGKIVVEKVESGIDTSHISNVEVAHKSESKHNYIELVLAVFDKLLDAECQKRKPHKSVDPHRIMLLNNGVGAHRIEDGADYDIGFIETASGFVEIKSHSKAGNSCLDKENTKERLENSALREKAYYIGKRTGDVICVNAKKFATELTGEGIEKRGVTENGISKCFIEINVLSVKIENEHGAVADGVQTH